MNAFAKELAKASLAGALNVIIKFVRSDKAKELADTVLNEVEGFFKEGSVPDEIAEEVTGYVREKLDIPDSDPGN